MMDGLERCVHLIALLDLFQNFNDMYIWLVISNKMIDKNDVALIELKWGRMFSRAIIKLFY